MKINTAILAGLLAVASPLASASQQPSVDAPFGYKAGSPESIANLKDKIKHVVWILLENRSFDNILGGVKRPGLDNPANNGDYCLPQNVSVPNSPKWCTSLKDYDSIANDPNHAITGNNLEFYGQFSPNNTEIADGQLKPAMLGFVNQQLISYPTISPEVAAKEVLGYYSEAEVPTLVDLVDEFTLFNYWFSCVPGVCWHLHLCMFGTMTNQWLLSPPTPTVYALSQVPPQGTERTIIASMSPASTSCRSSRRPQRRGSAG